MARTLLVIDVQNDYFPGGAYPLVGADDAAARAREVLHAFRVAGDPVLHMQHIAEPDAPFFRPDTPGAEIHETMRSADGEEVLVKAHPNSFLGTPLADRLRDVDTTELVVVGMMSSMCVDATTRAALDLGHAVTVVHDACAAPDLAFAGTTVPGATVHATFMAALGAAGAQVVAADALPAGAR